MLNCVHNRIQERPCEPCTDAELTRLRAERDALAAENRAILRLVDESHDLFRTACNVARDGIARGVSVDDAAKIMRDAVETRIGAINVAFRNFDAAREVERVKKLEAVAEAVRDKGYYCALDALGKGET